MAFDLSISTGGTVPIYRQMPHQVTDKLILVTADGLALRE